MKVSFSSSVGSSQASKAPARAPAGGGFAVSGAAQAAPTTAAARVLGVSPVASLDALLALQAVGGPLERRRRAMSRAGRILDVLDDMKIALLEGTMSPDALTQLMGAVREQRDQTEDAGLEGVLDEIETRAQVELAKMGMAA